MTDATGKRLAGWTPGVHLSERGREQAEAWSTPRRGPRRRDLLQSARTLPGDGAPLATARGLPIRDPAGLIEIGYGTWTGRSIAQVAKTKLWRRVQLVPSAVRFPGGEA